MRDPAGLMDALFNGMKAKPESPRPASTTDAPNIPLFMLQVINVYSRLIKKDSMQWRKAYRNKANGKEYNVTIILEESA